MEGIVEYVENNDNKITPGHVHYLPYRAAIRENNETIQLNIVFDASSKAKGERCLNGILYSGPCLLPYLYGILLRFPAGKFGLVANIKQAFLQIEITEEHRDLLSFLWFKNINDIPTYTYHVSIHPCCFRINFKPIFIERDSQTPS